MSKVTQVGFNSLVNSDATRRIIEWKFSGSTGVSSETMAAIALNVKASETFGYGVPHDFSDFGRCYRLVQEVPEIREVFPAISRKVPKFAGILNAWDDLCLLYEKGERQAMSKRLDALAEVKKAKRVAKMVPIALAA